MQRDKRILFCPVGINSIWKLDNVKAADGFIGEGVGAAVGKEGQEKVAGRSAWYMHTWKCYINMNN